VIKTLRKNPWLLTAALSVVGLAAMLAFGYNPFSAEAASLLLLANAPAGTELKQVMDLLDRVEAKMNAQAAQAEGQMKTLGKVSEDTKTAIDNLGAQQRELADRLLGLEQKGLTPPKEEKGGESWGQQFVKGVGTALGDLVEKRCKNVAFEVKNTITNTVGNTFSQRKPGVEGGAFRMFTLESLLNTLPTSSNAVDYVRENVFTNAAAETAEGALKPESSITTTLVTEPVGTVAHWLKISRQLAGDNAALAAYVDLRMRYGVNLRVENQIVAGNGTAPNISGFTKAGNFTAHGYTAASLTAAGLLNNRFDLIGKMLGDSMGADYPADTIVVNPADWWTMRLAKDSQGRYLLGDPGMDIAPSLFGVPVVASNAIAATNVLIASLRLAGTFYNREGVVIDMSESDGDNFIRNLITIRAERRCMLAVERPAAVRYGALVPA
jgi:HK97 family phage major capsid protein